MGRAAALIAVVIGIAATLVLLAKGSSAGPVGSDDLPEASATSTPDLPAIDLTDPRDHQQSSQGRTPAELRAPSPEEDLNERLENAETVAEVIALLAGEPPHDAVERVADEERYLTQSLQRGREALLAHRATANPNDPAHSLSGKKLHVDLIQTENLLSALRRGDYYFTAWPQSLPNGLAATSIGGSKDSPAYMIVVRKGNGPPLLQQLKREIDYAKKINEFNSYTEGYRRRILAHRQKSLRDGSPERLAWLVNTFPEGCRIDERTATIH